MVLKHLIRVGTCEESARKVMMKVWKVLLLQVQLEMKARQFIMYRFEYPAMADRHVTDALARACEAKVKICRRSGSDQRILSNESA